MMLDVNRPIPYANIFEIDYAYCCIYMISSFLLFSLDHYYFMLRKILLNNRYMIYKQ